ncbi:M4 family metallopeptidase [Mycobacterium paraterrae]|uniref:Neutral metalloproteinase n=1 Tax=Mycobacterium paraterrae TaxID=577492 RepID=A0ABY3VLH5_9MYCO|nr:M4 family metallopeptidase [Mycobacterium paraterrae]UMB69322.1 M4 family metallopeptidase [Mycobacterium paraterrae]
MRKPLNCILSPDLLVSVARDAAPEDLQAILSTIEYDHSFRQSRAEVAARQTGVSQAALAAVPAGGAPHRMIYDQNNSSDRVAGTLARSEGDPPVADASVNAAYDNFGSTYQFYWDVFARDSIDGQGMTISGLVHFGSKYDNAFWDGQSQMFFGDGDGRLLTDTTKGLDVIGHELTHGVTQHTANLVYSGQSGALNESISDVFGSLIKQYHLNQTAAQADWLIGADIVGSLLKPSLRSMKAPGTANPHDNQPADMDHYVQTTSDNGGVHINSGIPNRAFYVVASKLGGPAWKTAGTIWYDALTNPRLQPNATFAAFAAVTLNQARIRYGATSAEADAVSAGWDDVKVPVR